MATGWITVEELLAAKQVMIDEMPGWSMPAAYALGVRVDREVDFRVTNHRGTHDLPGIVLAKVLGYRAGSRSFPMSRALFERAISELEPAGACDAFDHPNLWAWQQLLLELSSGEMSERAEVIAVFIGDESDPPDSEPTRQLRRVLGIDS